MTTIYSISRPRKEMKNMKIEKYGFYFFKNILCLL